MLHLNIYKIEINVKKIFEFKSLISFIYKKYTQGNCYKIKSRKYEKILSRKMYPLTHNSSPFTLKISQLI